MTIVRPQIEGLPETVPARMVNEFVYCPRLFHLEWVQSRFASSDDVEEGLYVHRVVDLPSGDLTQDSEEAKALGGRKATSVWLSSPALGIAAKLDLVESDMNGHVIPVDYKKGHPQPTGEPWPGDRAQAALQALLLREHGYSCDRAEVWYAETRQRIPITVDDELLAWAEQTLADLWRVAAQDQAPAPLVDSPKCSKCSLVGVCLPDETNALLARSTTTHSKRRVVPREVDARPVYVQEQGTVVGTRRGRLEVFKDGKSLSSYRMLDVSQLCIRGNVTVTPQAMRELFAREVPVAWFTYGGWFAGVAEGLPSKNVDLRRSQSMLHPDAALDIARHMIEGKIRNSRTLLRRNARSEVDAPVEQLARLAVSARSAIGFPSLLGFEGTAARIYFAEFPRMLAAVTFASHFETNGRSRRPPPDPVNALLSFAYGLLVKDLTTTLYTVGFDPYQGLMHRPRFGRPALALDLAEEFRPVIAESVVLQLVNNGEVKDKDFRVRAGGCQLEADGRRATLRAYERRLTHEITHPHFGYRISYRRALEVQARLLAAHLLGELPTYVSFTTR
jgi:CRISPR-associated protein Cas1